MEKNISLEDETMIEENTLTTTDETNIREKVVRFLDGIVTLGNRWIYQQITSIKCKTM